ncbi:unnamed protein product, partial [Prorocentrum cordatum]
PACSGVRMGARGLGTQAGLAPRSQGDGRRGSGRRRRQRRRPAGARPAGARPLAGASPCLRRTRDLPLEAEAAARSSRGNIDGPNNPTKHGRELLGGHMPHANPTPTPQDF